MKARLAAVALLAFAGGCASLPPPGAEPAWPARRAALQALDGWTLDGRIAVAAGDSGFSGGFDWAQQGARADVTLTGPLGGRVMELRVDGGRADVTMRGEKLADTDSQALFAQTFGAGRVLPVAEMRYWLVGAPAPGLPHDEALDAQQRLAALTQSGWRVRYERYDAVGDQVLPARLDMSTEGLRLRVVVSRWRLP